MVSVGGRCLCIFPPSRLHKRLLLCSDSCDCCYIKKKNWKFFFTFFEEMGESSHSFLREWVNFLGEGLLPSTSPSNPLSFPSLCVLRYYYDDDHHHRWWGICLGWPIFFSSSLAVVVFSRLVALPCISSPFQNGSFNCFFFSFGSFLFLPPPCVVGQFFVVGRNQEMKAR